MPIERWRQKVADIELEAEGSDKDVKAEYCWPRGVGCSWFTEMWRLKVADREVEAEDR